MAPQVTSRSFSRRDFLRMAGTAAILGVGAAGLNLAPGRLNRVLAPVRVAEADREPDLYWAGTDGWIHLPDSPAIPPFFPDNYATPPFNLYIFGFRNITGLDPMQISGQKMKAQHSAPLFWLDQYNGSNEFHMRLTNLGLQQRPDLTDSHDPLARLSQRDSLLRRGADHVPFGAGQQELHLCLPATRAGYLYVSLPCRGCGARPHGHDGAGIRAAGAGPELRLQ
jgi:hypothetical protein